MTVPLPTAPLGRLVVSAICTERIAGRGARTHGLQLQVISKIVPDLRGLLVRALYLQYEVSTNRSFSTTFLPFNKPVWGFSISHKQR